MPFAELAGAIIISLLISAVTLILSELLKPKPKLEDARPASLGDFNFPTAVEGRAIPIIFGTVQLKGPNVVWYGDLRARKITESIKTGLWSSKRIAIGYMYHVGFQMGLCRGRVDELRRIWVGDDILSEDVVQDGAIEVDKPTMFGGDHFGNGGMQGTVRVYSGTETQDGNDYLADFQDPLVPHRGTCYVVWEGGYVGNSTSIKPWKFELSRWPNGLGLTSNHHKVNTLDSNPAAVVYELLTNNDWGFGFTSSDVDVTQMRTAGDTLFDEGNGFSFVVDRKIPGTSLLDELQRQADGTVFMDQATGKFQFGLARGGYDVDDLFQLDSSNVLSVTDFTRGTWDETINQVHVQFADRARDYFETYAEASDLANQRIQGGETVTLEQRYPGVKDRDLASQIAGRELLLKCVPLVKASITVDRTAFSVKPNDVVSWTDETFGFVDLPMRVATVDYGELRDGQIKLGCIQDVFEFTDAFSGRPPDTGWEPPSTEVDPFPAEDQRVFEAPYALVRRDPDAPQVLGRAWAGAARETGGESAFRIWQRHAPAAPAGAYSLDSADVPQFFLMGELRNDLDPTDAAGTFEIDVDPVECTVPELVGSFTANPAAADVGQNLVNLIMVNGEFMAPKSATNQGAYATLNNVWRGMLDTVPGYHLAGDRVYLIFLGGDLNASPLPEEDDVDVKLVPSSFTETLPVDDATVVAFTMNRRARRPYPPTQLELNGNLFDPTVDVDALKPAGTTLDERGVNLTFTRRDWRQLDETAQILDDAADLDASFPGFNSTEYAAEIFEEDGSPSSLFVEDFADTAEIFMSRTKILRYNGGTLPTDMSVEVEARHDNPDSLEASQKLRFEFSKTTSVLDDDFALGVLDTNVTSAAWTAPTTGTYAFTIGTSLLSSGAVEARINAGAWTPVITTGNTTGNLAGVVAADTVEVRHTQTGSDLTETFLEVDAPATAANAYAVLVI